MCHEVVSQSPRYAGKKARKAHSSDLPPHINSNIGFGIVRLFYRSQTSYNLTLRHKIEYFRRFVSKVFTYFFYRIIDRIVKNAP